MAKWSVSQLREGMSVEDADGDKVGAVRAVYQPRRIVATTSNAADPAGELVLKVHAGLPLLGTDWYIPGSAAREIVEDRIILRIDESEVEAQGWDQRPAWIKE